MFFHKTGPFLTAFALTAAALIAGTTAASANGEFGEDNYCDEGGNCAVHYAGIVQTERDGVNYFYGSSDKTFGYTSYQVLRIDYTDHTPSAAPEFMQPNEIIQYVPYGHSLRPWRHKLKPGHKAGRLGFIPEHFRKSQFRHRNKVYHPAAP